jgi:cytochrome c biogenesis protein
MTSTQTPGPTRREKRAERRRRESPRNVSELRPIEFARWLWRQLTSMRTALILLLLLALVAVPGSLIPQENIDSQKTTAWQNAHTTLTPVYERLGLFKVYETPWFAAIYILLMISLIGCIVPRLFVYWRGFRAQPPAVPLRLSRMPDSSSYTTSASPEDVAARAQALLRKRRYRLRKDGASATETNSVAAEKGYLREAGNLVFHLSILLVLVGFAMGGLFGYKGGVIVMVGKDYGFANELTQYDDFDPGSLFSAKQLNYFHFNIDSFQRSFVNNNGSLMGTAFHSNLSYQTSPGGPTRTDDLQVNHPLSIGSTEVFLIGWGYAPDITVRDGQGNVAYSGPTVFLPQDSSFLSFGVVKAPYAKPQGIGIQGLFYPAEGIDPTTQQPINLVPDAGDGSASVLSMQVYEGDLNLGGSDQSVYDLDTSKMKLVPNTGGQAWNLQLGKTATLPHDLGSITFNGIDEWNKVQISQQPGRQLALLGVCLALLGLLGSLFIRPRRVWVRAVAGAGEEGGTLVEVAALDRSGGGDTAAVVRDLVDVLQRSAGKERA